MRASGFMGPALNRVAGARSTMQKIVQRRDADADAAAWQTPPGPVSGVRSLGDGGAGCRVRARRS
jgi:hypothetical protein